MENIIKDIKHYSKYLMLAMQDLEEFINANKENDKEKKKKLYFRKYYRKYYNNHSYTCSACGIDVKTQNKKSHEKSQRHEKHTAYFTQLFENENL